MYVADLTETSRTREVSLDEQETFRKVLADAIRIVEDETIPYVVTGSTAANVWGRPTSIGDIDLVIDPTDAKRLLKRFASEGYDTEEAEPHWLYKAKRDGCTVDLIFVLSATMYLDDQMLDHAVDVDIEGTQLRLISPEDFVVSQAIAFEEDTPDYWFHGLGVLTKTDVDWDYLLQRASHGPRRVLSMLAFGQADDLAIPEKIIRRLFDLTYGT